MTSSVLGLGGERGECDGGCGVARHRLEDQRLGRGARGDQLVLDQIGMTLARDDDRCREVFRIGALRGQLQHGLVRGQREQLLGHFRLGHGPKSRAGAAGQDDRNDRIVHECPFVDPPSPIG
jgi:hypothetical protein